MKHQLTKNSKILIIVLCAIIIFFPKRIKTIYPSMFNDIDIRSFCLIDMHPGVPIEEVADDDAKKIIDSISDKVVIRGIKPRNFSDNLYSINIYYNGKIKEIIYIENKYIVIGKKCYIILH